MASEAVGGFDRTRKRLWWLSPGRPVPDRPDPGGWRVMPEINGVFYAARAIARIGPVVATEENPPTIGFEIQFVSGKSEFLKFSTRTVATLERMSMVDNMSWRERNSKREAG